MNGFIKICIFVSIITIIMKGRPTIHQDDQVIKKAQAVFWEKGYSATSLTDLSTATGAGAGSLYNTFKGGKKELFKAALQQRREDLHEFKQKLKDSEKPLELIKDFFRSIANEDKHAHQRGCIVANTVVEMSFVDEELKEEAVKILKETEQMYTSVIADEQKKGNLITKVPADALGKYLISCWCGINTLRRIYPVRKLLAEQIELQLQLIK
jgi:TetR/AcrR family transcriptional regulator, transcriptional repressor for nem operon